MVNFLRQAFALLCFLLPAAGQVTARLDRASVPAGLAALLEIEVRDSKVTEPEPPAVPGLIIQGGGRTYQVQLSNGIQSATTTFSYRVGSAQPGDYTIPAFTLKVNGQEVKTTPLQLKVTPAADPAVPPGSPPPGSPGAPQDRPPPDSEPGFLTVEMAVKDRAHVWVGEIAPVRIKAWLPPGAQVSLSSSLQPEGSAFTLHNISGNPQQDIEVRNGRQYRVVTWHGGLSAAKAGTYPPDLKIKAVITMRDPAGGRRSGRGRDPFDDPFFDQFLAPVIRKDVVLSSSRDENGNIEVRALPREGRPGGFSGAVGKFTLSQTVIPPAWKTGEPQQVTAVITGEGNFNLLRQPDLQPESSWKTYPGQTDFAARDVASFAGIQTCRFNAVARQPGPSGVSLSFSYFDPATAKYETVTSPPQHVEVTGAAPAVPSAAAPASPRAPADPLRPLWTADSGIRPLTPAAFRSFFPLTLAAAAAALTAGLAAGPWRRWRHHPQRKARAAAELATRAALAEAESLAARGDAAGFFSAARRALQSRLAVLWQHPAQAITLADVNRRTGPGSPVAALFEEADRIAYSPGTAAAPDDLAPWRALLHQAMHSLNTPPAA